MSLGNQLMRLGQGDGIGYTHAIAMLKIWKPPHWWTIRQIYRVRPESCRSTVGSSPAPPSKSLINVGKNSYRPVLRECPRFDGVPAIALEMHIQGILKWLSILQIRVGARIPNTVQYDSRQHTVRWY